MQATASPNYLSARISIMSQRLQPAVWFQQIAAKPSNDTAQIFQDLGLIEDPQQADSYHAEHRMLETFLNEFKILLRPHQGLARRFLLQWIRHIELRNLKTILHGALLHRPTDDIRTSMLHMGDLETLPFKQLLQADDILEMLRIMDKTVYASMSRQARRLFEQHNDPFFVNASIDQRYFNDLVNSIGLMPDADKPWLNKLLGLIVDRHNLIWLLRYRFTYDLKAPETWYLLSPGGHHLSSSTLYTLVNLESADRVFERLPEPLGRIIGERRNLFDIELALEKVIEEQTWDILKQQESMITRALAWLILREKQLLRVRGILKGQQLSLSTDIVTFAMGLGE